MMFPFRRLPWLFSFGRQLRGAAAVAATAANEKKKGNIRWPDDDVIYGYGCCRFVSFNRMLFWPGRAFLHLAKSHMKRRRGHWRRQQRLLPVQNMHIICLLPQCAAYT